MSLKPESSDLIFIRMPPNVSALASPVIITEEEFNAALESNTFTRDSYAFYGPGCPATTLDSLRFSKDRRVKPRFNPRPEVRACIESVQNELIPVNRLLNLISAGIDNPALLTAHLAPLQEQILNLIALLSDDNGCEGITEELGSEEIR